MCVCVCACNIQLFGSELVAGLHYLHSNSILFCDLKPANILIDEFGSLKVCAISCLLL